MYGPQRGGAPTPVFYWHTTNGVHFVCARGGVIASFDNSKVASNVCQALNKAYDDTALPVIHGEIDLSKIVSGDQVAFKGIVAVNQCGDSRTGTLAEELSKADIVAALGFSPNCEDDGDKVTMSWGFSVDGVRGGIWDYKGGRWSTWGPHEMFEKLFPGKHHVDRF